MEETILNKGSTTQFSSQNGEARNESLESASISRIQVFFIFLFWLALSYLALEIIWFYQTKFVPFTLPNFLNYLTSSNVRPVIGYSLVSSVIATLLVLLAIFYKKFRIIILIVGPIIGLLLAGYGFSISTTLSNLDVSSGGGLGLILASVFSTVIYNYYWMILVAVLPIAWALKEHPTTILSLAKKTIPPGTILLLVFILLGMGVVYPTRSSYLSEQSQLKSEIEQAKSRLNPLFKPTYVPDKFDQEPSDILTEEDEFFTSYKCIEGSGGLRVGQTTLKQSKNDDIKQIETEIRNNSPRSLEIITLNNLPALYIENDLTKSATDKELIFYVQDWRLILKIPTGCKISKDELIKVAESVKSYPQ